MFSPGGFDSTLESWRTVGVYRRLALLDHLSTRYTCITFDRRESGSSGGRVQRIRWQDYVAQAVGLLDHLDVASAHLMGGCVGCSTAAAVAVAHPDRVSSMVLYSPAGGVKYRMKQHARFAQHLAFVEEQGLRAVVDLVGATQAGFTKDPRVGPWNSVVRADPDFADAYARIAPERYAVLVSGTARLMFDRDTVPGAEPEDLLELTTPTLVVPGQDDSHAPSAARYLQECLPHAEYWDAPVVEQTEDTAPARILAFLDSVEQPAG
ncbi:alpha/beta hydrolase [Blastococcus saxobsidens]|uniref:Alpha/beta hydrolase n=2 Tax=Blastococcus saxobsidens TaxID=138336 RepID=A0A6L9W1U1_9ACTN|nr:alpha/beta hydrolase [Blastococcus saxobsidens]NEK85955.1 alpha/beta hydrolase [Blastococcus saxobsidens]